MGDNNLLGNTSESTEEELLRRLQLIKENPLENSADYAGDRDFSDNVWISDTFKNWLTSFEQNENVTSGQREHQPWSEASQVNPQSDFRFIQE